MKRLSAQHRDQQAGMAVSQGKLEAALQELQTLHVSASTHTAALQSLTRELNLAASLKIEEEQQAAAGACQTLFQRMSMTSNKQKRFVFVR